MMKEPVNDDIFKTWVESQKRVWESLSTILPNLPSSEGHDTWHKAYQENLATWEAAVKQTLKAEATWVEQWAHQLNQAEMVPQPLSEWTHQMEKVMQHWLSTQARLWEDCFTALRDVTEVSQREGGVITEASKPPATADMTAKPLDKDQHSTPPTSPEAKELIPEFPAREDITPRSPSAVALAKDDLKTINGIGPVLEQKLNDIGITSYRQIATLTPEASKRIETAVTKMAGRIQRDRWIEQAKEQHLKKYKKTL